MNLRGDRRGSNRTPPNRCLPGCDWLILGYRVSQPKIRNAQLRVAKGGMTFPSELFLFLLSLLLLLICVFYISPCFLELDSSGTSLLSFFVCSSFDSPPRYPYSPRLSLSPDLVSTQSNYTPLTGAIFNSYKL